MRVGLEHEFGQMRGYRGRRENVGAAAQQVEGHTVEGALRVERVTVLAEHALQALGAVDEARRRGALHGQDGVAQEFAQHTEGRGPQRQLVAPGVQVVAGLLDRVGREAVAMEQGNQRAGRGAPHLIDVFAAPERLEQAQHGRVREELHPARAERQHHASVGLGQMGAQGREALAQVWLPGGIAARDHLPDVAPASSGPVEHEAVGRDRAVAAQEADLHLAVRALFGEQAGQDREPGALRRGVVQRPVVRKNEAHRQGLLVDLAQYVDQQTGAARLRQVIARHVVAAVRCLEAQQFRPAVGATRSRCRGPVAAPRPNLEDPAHPRRPRRQGTHRPPPADSCVCLSLTA